MQRFFFVFYLTKYIVEVIKKKTLFLLSLSLSLFFSLFSALYSGRPLICGWLRGLSSLRRSVVGNCCTFGIRYRSSGRISGNCRSCACGIAGLCCCSMCTLLHPGRGWFTCCQLFCHASSSRICKFQNNIQN